MYSSVGAWAGMEHLPNVGQVCLNESVHRAISNFGIQHYDDATLLFFPKPKFSSQPQAKTGGSVESDQDDDDEDLAGLPPVPTLARANTTVDMHKMLDTEDEAKKDGPGEMAD